MSSKAKFCLQCGSILITGVCSNRKCSGYVSKYVTLKQKALIEELSDEEYDFSSMTQKEASEIISELLEGE